MEDAGEELCRVLVWGEGNVEGLGLDRRRAGKDAAACFGFDGFYSDLTASLLWP